MVNKACFRKSIIKDFVLILTIIITLVIAVIGCLMFNALVPILAPFGSAFNWVIACYTIILLFLCFIPFIGKPEDLKEFPTVGLIAVGYLFGAMPFISYYAVALRNRGFPDILPLTVGWVILMLICIPISMGYARCRNE